MLANITLSWFETAFEYWPNTKEEFSEKNSLTRCFRVKVEAAKKSRYTLILKIGLQYGFAPIVYINSSFIMLTSKKNKCNFFTVNRKFLQIANDTHQPIPLSIYDLHRNKKKSVSKWYIFAFRLEIWFGGLVFSNILTLIGTTFERRKMFIFSTT